jgi:glycosyltransferase involved in cell wall biosynthesis
MKVCLLTRYFDFKNAGIGRVSSEILKGLRKEGLEVIPISATGVTLHSYFKYSMFDVPKMLPKDIDLYHALTPIEGIWIPKGRSVVTILDLIPITHPERAGAGIGRVWWKNFIGRNYFEFATRIASRAKIIITISNEVKEDIIKVLKVPERKIRVLKLGISKDLEPLNYADNKFRIGYLGQLDRRKRVDVLIKAFKESSLDAELVIGGAGLDEALLKELAEGDRRIRFWGFVNESQLVGFYNSLDLFIFPTWIEGYGLPPVEAMACKKPVVVLRDVIMPKEVKDRCIVTDSLESLFSTNLNFGPSIDIEGNYKWAKTHSWEACINEHIKIYREVIDG